MQRADSLTLTRSDYRPLLLIGLLGQHESHSHLLSGSKLLALLSCEAGEIAPSSYCPAQDLLRQRRQTQHLHSIFVSRLSFHFGLRTQIILFHAE
jgi:hypothetical protein